MLRLNVDMKSSLTIGEVAVHFDLPTHVLRHWESVGLLSPARVSGDRRCYTREDMFRVASIVRAKQAGLPLPEIREILTAPTPPERQAVLTRHRETLHLRLAQLQAALDLLNGAIDCRHQDLITCPHFQSQLAEMVDSKE
jgi:DNA-binding transcriptional MerR regulator